MDSFRSTEFGVWPAFWQHQELSVTSPSKYVFFFFPFLGKISSIRLEIALSSQCFVLGLYLVRTDLLIGISICPQDRKLLIAEPDILSFDLQDLRLQKPSFLILASDGLWDAFSNEEAAFYVRQRLHEPHLGARSLAMQAYQRGSVDNITVLVVNLSNL